MQLDEVLQCALVVVRVPFPSVGVWVSLCVRFSIPVLLSMLYVVSIVRVFVYY